MFRLFTSGRKLVHKAVKGERRGFTNFRCKIIVKLLQYFLFRKQTIKRCCNLREDFVVNDNVQSLFILISSEYMGVGYDPPLLYSKCMTQW